MMDNNEIEGVISLRGKIVGFTREKQEASAEALREILTNALCHRQFHNTSSSVWGRHIC